jgi:hypothetical protein
MSPDEKSPRPKATAALAAIFLATAALITLLFTAAHPLSIAAGAAGLAAGIACIVGGIGAYRRSVVLPEVQSLMWDAAEHAARIAEIDADLTEMRYAETGSPAAVYRDELQGMRADHLAAMGAIQRQAEGGARAAGQASAAAKLARERTGSAYDLDVVVAGATRLETTSALDAAKQRLELATAAWSELDETTTLLRAKLAADAERQEQRRGQPQSGA